jgi:hypothetical protein
MFLILIMGNIGKTFALLLVLLFLMPLVLLPSSNVKAQSKTIVVPDQYPTIQSAIDNASAGDSVFIKNGTYNEQVLIVDKPLQIIGENANNSKIILHPSLIFGGYHSLIPYYYYHESIVISANNVELSNFTISYQETNEPPSDLSQHILGSTSSYTSPTYLAEGGGAIIISGNNSKVTGNIFNNTPVTIEGSNSQISANSFEMGAECRGSNNHIFHNNFIYQFFNGKKDVPSVYDVSDSVNYWDDGYPSGGNYWVDYQTRYADAKMIDGTGIGDTPYLIGSNNYDRYPLMSPYNYTSYIMRITPPSISIISPMNLTYFESNVSLDFKVNKPINWVSYSLDGALNRTILSNSTLSELSIGLHNVTIYANDTFGNVSNQTVNFAVEKPQTGIFGSQTTVLAIVVPVAIICLVAGLLLYWRHRKTKSTKIE